MKTSEITTTTTTAEILAEYKAAIRKLLKADLIAGEAIDAAIAIPERWVHRAEKAYNAYAEANAAARDAWIEVERIRSKAKKEGVILGEYDRPMLSTLQRHRAEIMDGSVEFDIEFHEEAL